MTNTNKHYVIVCDWSNDGMCENGVTIVGVAHSPEEAKKIFSEEVIKERTIANDNCWEILENSETEFNAGNDGHYNVEHTHLYIVEVDPDGFTCMI